MSKTLYVRLGILYVIPSLEDQLEYLYHYSKISIVKAKAGKKHDVTRFEVSMCSQHKNALAFSADGGHWTYRCYETSPRPPKYLYVSKCGLYQALVTVQAPTVPKALAQLIDCV